MQSSGDSVTDLALAAAYGDRGALDAFVRATQADVWRFVAHLAGPADADDLTQETFLRACRSLPGFRARSSARTWLLAIARRVIVDQVRHAVRRPRTAAVDDWRRAAERQQARGAGHSGGQADIMLLLDEVPVERREALVLTQIVGLTYEEAARVCGCPVGTIRSRVARARDDLVRHLRGGQTRSG